MSFKKLPARCMTPTVFLLDVGAVPLAGKHGGRQRLAPRVCVCGGGGGGEKPNRCAPVSRHTGPRAPTHVPLSSPPFPLAHHSVAGPLFSEPGLDSALPAHPAASPLGAGAPGRSPREAEPRLPFSRWSPALREEPLCPHLGSSLWPRGSLLPFCFWNAFET